MATIPDAIQQAYGAYLPKKSMRYGAQVVWCLDSGDKELMYSAHCIHGKRVAIGDGWKSAVVCGAQPEWPNVPDTENVRLVIVAHGVLEALPNRIKICTTKMNEPAENAEIPLAARFAALRNRGPAAPPPPADICIEAEPFCNLVKAFILKSPKEKVERISLNVCYSAGIARVVSLEESPAQMLMVKCRGLVTSVTGRRGKSVSSPHSVLKADMDEICDTGRNPLYSTKRADGKDVFVVGHTNKVKTDKQQKEDYETYVFEADSKPQLKPKYTREEDE